MVISQFLVNKIEWNKFHFVAHLIAYKMNINLTSGYTSSFFLGDENPIVCFFSDPVVVLFHLIHCAIWNYKNGEMCVNGV